MNKEEEYLGSCFQHGLWLLLSWGTFWARSPRQTGHTAWLDNHVSAHNWWNPWLQPGTRRADWQLSIFSRQTGHSVDLTAKASSFPVSFGSFSSSETERPLPVTSLTGSENLRRSIRRRVEHHKKKRYMRKTMHMPTQGRRRAMNRVANMVPLPLDSTVAVMVGGGEGNIIGEMRV